MQQELRSIIDQMIVGVEQAIADNRTAEARQYRGYDGQLLLTAQRYTYQYSLRTFCDVQENAKIVLMHPKSRVQLTTAKVVSLEGMSITLTTKEVLPAECLQEVLLIEDAVWLLERQRDVLRLFASGQMLAPPISAKALGLLPAQYGAKRVQEQFGTFTPNQRQQQAIEQALGSDITIVVGAGGTGKSAVEAHVSAYGLQDHLSVLLLSHTNIATDNLFLNSVQTIENSGNKHLLSLLQKQQIVRVGEPRHQSLLTGNYRHLTVNGITEQRMGELAQEEVNLEEKVRKCAVESKRVEHLLHQHEEAWQKEQERFQQQKKSVQEDLDALTIKYQEYCQDVQRRIVAAVANREEARKQLEKLQVQQTNMDKQLLGWQRYIDTPIKGEPDNLTGQLEYARQQLAHVQNSRWFSRRLVMGRKRYEAIVKDMELSIEALQAKIADVNQQIANLKQAHEENLHAQKAFRETMQQATEERKYLEQAYHNTAILHEIARYQRALDQLERALDNGKKALAERRQEWEKVEKEQTALLTRLDELRNMHAAMKSQIVANAQLVASTITGIYTNPDLLRRDFDIVIVDEVSMLSVVGAFLAANRARYHLIFAGDPTQLLPVLKLHSKQPLQDAPEAFKWLGQDLLTHRGITIFDAILGEKGCVQLKEQGRMHPKILAPINHFVYQDTLTSRPETEVAPPIAPHPEWPLMLIDTGDSSESKTEKSALAARTNLYHVKVAIALIPQLLATLPPRLPHMDPAVPRISILTPYRSQANKMLQALRKANLAQHVHVGTINTAQALQFEVVILDTVEAPGLPPIPFTFDAIMDRKGIATEATRRLNVGHTRARHKLIYIANVEYLRRYQLKNPMSEPGKQRLLMELVNWIVNREGCCVTSAEVLA
jgi:predicted  nucleic acid-binding Zn-ribbon protein